VITSVVYDVYLIFYDNLSFLAWFGAVRRVKALIETCVPAAFFVVNLDFLMVLDFACERIYFSS
jgi:hypothetical protein